MDVRKLLRDRCLPQLLSFKDGKKVSTKEDLLARQSEIANILQSLEYGNLPKLPDEMTVEVLSEDKGFSAGRATLRALKFSFRDGDNFFSFPAYSVIPVCKTEIPAFVHINFSSGVPDKYLPSEEIADGGFAVFSFCYKDVTSDDGDFNNGIAKYLCPDRSLPNAPGKIAIWAWAAMRIMDYVQTRPEIDKANVAVIGHSRLGKTALFAGGLDTRFKYVISNNSGCSGAALSRGKSGETKAKIIEVFPHWFCPEYLKDPKPEELPFDQHFLLALTAPRHLMVGSAEDDLWADPTSEFLSIAAASCAWKILGKSGLMHKNEIPKAKTVLDEGECAYHVRTGAHYLSREDWAVYMNYINKHILK